MPTLIMESSPKFITCPDCGERYDNAKKRRLIDICGHPRCYSCLFVDAPCPLCEKFPKQRPRASSSSAKESSNDSLDKDVVSNNTVGSHPNLNELHKERSSTLPPSFRKDSHFKSLYRHQPHGSSESLSSRSSTPPSGRPRSLPPSYHVSIENLNEQFWKSVELAEKKWSPRRRNKEKQETTKNSNETGNNVRPDVVECPAPDVIKLPVPAGTHPKSQLEHHMRGRGDKKSVPARRIITEIIERPRSFSDVDNNQRCRSVASDVTDSSCESYPRPLSWSPTQFPINYRTPSSRASSSRYSDSSSIYLSDTWSESSDSDSIQSPTQEKTEINDHAISSDDHRQIHSSPRKYKSNPLANVTYWVVNSGSSVEVHKGFADNENNDRATQCRPKVKVTHQWNGPTENGLVSAHNANNTM